MKRTTAFAAAAAAAAAAGAAAFALGTADAADGRDVSSRTEESSVTTNDNGVVSRAYTECSVTTNGNMVTERRRETRTNMDQDGNVFETSTSEFAQSYSVGDSGAAAFAAASAGAESGPAPRDSSSFLGLAFGEPHGTKETEFEADPEEPALLRAAFVPKTPLEGFDRYFAYVTPKTHRVAKIRACAVNAVEPGPRWRRHYLIEALERRYGTWARPCSYRRPCFAFRIGPDRFATVCLADASPEFQTIVEAWDNAVTAEAVRETEELRAEARKNAAEKRSRLVDAAAAAF